MPLETIAPNSSESSPALIEGPLISRLAKTGPGDAQLKSCQYYGKPFRQFQSLATNCLVTSLRCGRLVTKISSHVSCPTRSLEKEIGKLAKKSPIRTKLIPTSFISNLISICLLNKAHDP
ncbi:Hypothetical predicted protein [Podarcis lilfordi]|uniref:Uncharacterized protein n=1 Tax=Podarcis lilfordi TaxID=74358 RepID=A0AA35JNU9_9SAUR|nr:Hypothetical predicted protein [Podarcis lilfordi]